MARATRRVLSSAGFVLLGFGLATGCGGQSFDNGSSSDGGESGESGTSGTASGGGGRGGSSGSSPAKGGSPGTGGVSPNGGAPPAGGASPAGGVAPTGGVGMSGTAGAGGEPSVCLLPPEPGPCFGAFGRFAFDEPTGLCLPFTYGGCEGNANNFETIESCYGTCGGLGQMDPAECNSPLDCLLVPSKCCDCSDPSLANRVAIRNGEQGAVDMAMGCPLVDCATCELPAPNPTLGATCKAGRCMAFDLRQTDLVACLENLDCRLRAGVECCENCSAQALDFVALNKNADVAALMCGDTPVDCDACDPVWPASITPLCVNGRCEAVTNAL